MREKTDKMNKSKTIDMILDAIKGLSPTELKELVENLPWVIDFYALKNLLKRETSSGLKFKVTYGEKVRKIFTLLGYLGVIDKDTRFFKSDGDDFFTDIEKDPEVYESR